MLYQSENTRLMKSKSVADLRLMINRGEQGSFEVRSLAPDGSMRFFNQYKGVGPNEELVVEFFGSFNGPNQTTTVLQIDPVDPRLARLVIDASVANRYRFNSIRFKCMGKKGDEELVLIKGILLFDF